MTEHEGLNRIGRGLARLCAALRTGCARLRPFGGLRCSPIGHGGPEGRTPCGGLQFGSLGRVGYEDRTQCGGPQPPAAEARISRNAHCVRSAGCVPNRPLVGGMAEGRMPFGGLRLSAAGSRGRCARLALGALLLAAVGCGGRAGEFSEDAGMVNLAIGVDVGDAAAPQEGYADAANDDEKMQTLRVVVVRPDGTIEHNRLLSGFAPTVRLDGTADADGTVFKVVGGERKRIYLFVNEGTELRASDGTLRRVIDYDFDRKLVPGTFFPREELEACLISLENATQQLAGPLPMNGCHDVWMPKKNYACTLTVLRAAVKFSFLIRNACGSDLTLTELTLDRMADRSWYLPRGDYDADGVPTRFEVPATAGYYPFSLGDDLSEALPRGETTQLRPIYLLEGQYTDPADARNYAMHIGLDGARIGGYFENLKTLPRNTHVVVRITLTDRETTWTAELVPYGAVKLDPVFGLD